MARADDVNGDALSDIVVGAQSAMRNTGRTHVFIGTMLAGVVV